MMNEKLLQLIWRYSLYNPLNLKTINCETVTVVHPGKFNTDAGPDFAEAKIRIGKTLLVGNIELHVRTSDWYKHSHQQNPAYSNLILHVVYIHDRPYDEYNHIPLVVLSDHIPHNVIDNYCNLQFNNHDIPCASHLQKVRTITREGWLSRLIAERWEMKLQEWDELLQQSAGDWRVLLYWRMASNFGFKVNADAFLLLARSINVNILGRHRENLFQLEALLFGQAGLLEDDFRDEYPAALQEEYRYLKGKYSLEPIPGHLWKFLRLRPANFPTVRIAQFAALVHRSLHLFTQIVTAPVLHDLTSLFHVTASSYWDNHVRFDEEQKTKAPKQLGKDSIYNIIINTVAPVQYMYSSRSGIGDYNHETAFRLLEMIPPEINAITSEWKSHGWSAANAAQSQALIQLYNHYCHQKRCGECSIGHTIIKSGP